MYGSMEEFRTAVEWRTPARQCLDETAANIQIQTDPILPAGTRLNIDFLVAPLSFYQHLALRRKVGHDTSCTFRGPRDFSHVRAYFAALHIPVGARDRAPP